TFINPHHRLDPCFHNTHTHTHTHNLHIPSHLPPAPPVKSHLLSLPASQLIHILFLAPNHKTARPRAILHTCDPPYAHPRSSAPCPFQVRPSSQSRKPQSFHSDSLSSIPTID